MVGLIQLFLQFLKMHEMQANTLHATLIVKTLKNRFWVEIDTNPFYIDGVMCSLLSLAAFSL